MRGLSDFGYSYVYVIFEDGTDVYWARSRTLEYLITLQPKSKWRKSIRSQEQLVAELDRALRLPGLSNAWTMPVKGRIDMLTTGIRTPAGLKIAGADWAAIENIGAKIEAALATVRGTRSVFAERTGSGYYLDVEWDRDALARYGLSIDEAQVAVQNAVGGENVTTVIRGRDRYPVNVRYMRDFRSNLDALGLVLVSAAGGKPQNPAGGTGHLKVGKRAGDAARRRRLAHGLRICRCFRPGSRQLRGRSRTGGP